MVVRRTGFALPESTDRRAFRLPRTPHHCSDMRGHCDIKKHARGVSFGRGRILGGVQIPTPDFAGASRI